MYAQEVAELMPSILSTAWTTNISAGGGCIQWEGAGGTCPIAVNATIVHGDIPYYPGERIDNRPIRVVSRLLLEKPPTDALSNYFCAHLITVAEASAPLVVDFEFKGLPSSITYIHRLFDGDWKVNISAESIARDIIGGKSAVIHRIGCNDQGKMLPLPVKGELVKGGDMEQMTSVGPGQLLSDHHSGPWYLVESGASQDPLHPGHLLPSGTLTDDRMRINADTAIAHGGRRAAKVNVPTNQPVLFPVPVGRLPPGGLLHVNLSLYARCSPAGLTLTPTVSGVAFALASSGSSGMNTTVELSSHRWQHIQAHGVVLNGSTHVPARHTLMQLQLQSPFRNGGTVWIDDLSAVIA